MIWRLDGERPIYLQLIEQIQLRIISGRYASGDRLPAVRELAAEALVNPNTMQRALTELESEGLVITRRTAGRVVTDDIDMINIARKRVAERYADDYAAKMTELGLSKEEIKFYLEEAFGKWTNKTQTV